MIRRLVLASLVLVLLPVGDLVAQGRRGTPPEGRLPIGGDGGSEAGALSIRAPREIQEAAGLIETGVRPIYPREVSCPQVASLFGSQTRFDGSSRRGEANNGFHAGIDISAAEGTALVAIADGAVVHKREGGMLAGIQIFFQHSPEDTGLPAWLYSKYQHLMEPSQLAVGDRVKVGQIIGVSGKTGTTGGHYGVRGYPHLHLSLYAGRTADYAVTLGGALPHDGRFVDPLALYLGTSLDSHVLHGQPEAQKRFAVPYKRSDGPLVPSEARVIWPFLCSPR
jgi:murein DD-endopeptidase MepM/ murein hydrolase activator NlpD